MDDRPLACFHLKFRFLFEEQFSSLEGTGCDQEAVARIERTCGNACVGNDLEIPLTFACAVRFSNLTEAGCEFSNVESDEATCVAVSQDCLSVAHAIGFGWAMSVSLIAVLFAQR